MTEQNKKSYKTVVSSCHTHQRRSITPSMKREICLYRETHHNLSLSAIAAHFNVKWSMPLTKYTVRYIIRASDKWLSEKSLQGDETESEIDSDKPSDKEVTVEVPEGSNRNVLYITSDITSDMKHEICLYKIKCPRTSFKTMAELFSEKWNISLSVYNVRYIVRQSHRWLPLDGINKQVSCIHETKPGSRFMNEQVTVEMKREICMYKLLNPGVSNVELAAHFNIKWSLPISPEHIRRLLQKQDKWLHLESNADIQGSEGATINSPDAEMTVPADNADPDTHPEHPVLANQSFEHHNKSRINISASQKDDEQNRFAFHETEDLQDEDDCVSREEAVKSLLKVIRYVLDHQLCQDYQNILWGILKEIWQHAGQILDIMEHDDVTNGHVHSPVTSQPGSIVKSSNKELESDNGTQDVDIKKCDEMSGINGGLEKWSDTRLNYTSDFEPAKIKKKVKKIGRKKATKVRTVLKGQNKKILTDMKSVKKVGGKTNNESLTSSCALPVKSESACASLTWCKMHTGRGIYTTSLLSRGLLFGPYDGATNRPWEVQVSNNSIPEMDGKSTHWMAFVRCQGEQIPSNQEHSSDQVTSEAISHEKPSKVSANLEVSRVHGKVYYVTTTDIPANSELVLNITNQSKATREISYQCQACGKQFRHSWALTYHERVHTGEKPHKCKFCGQGFARPANLKCHERSHTNDRPFLCNECGKAFVQRADLVKHMRTHTGEKPFACDVCGQTYAQRCQVIRHRRTHTGEKPYSCPFCQQKFSDTSTLRKHRKRCELKHEGDGSLEGLTSASSHHNTTKAQNSQILVNSNEQSNVGEASYTQLLPVPM